MSCRSRFAHPAGAWPCAVTPGPTPAFSASQVFGPEQHLRDALPNFVKLAEAYGHVGMRIDKPEDVEPALKEAFSRKDDLVFMDFITDQTENVFPMVPGGKGLSEMILV